MIDLQDIVEAFDFLGDWESRYQYLIELGEKLPHMPEANRTEERRVAACMSKVWIRAYPDPDNSEQIRFEGECDTAVIKGVLALLIELTSGKTAQAIQLLDHAADLGIDETGARIVPVDQLAFQTLVDRAFGRHRLVSRDLASGLVRRGGRSCGELLPSWERWRRRRWRSR